MSAPIIIHIFNGEIGGIECADDIPKIIIVSHVTEKIASTSPKGSKTPDGYALLEIAGPGHAEKPTEAWREWADNLFD